MGRFYQAPQTPQFIDGLYTPPWELMDKALSYNQQGYDNAVATTNLFQDIDINSINDPIVKEQVDSIKKYYESKSNELTKTIQANPLDWKKSKIAIQNLGRELQEDMKRGSISRIQSAHESMQNFVKEHEEYAKKNPGLFNQGYNYFLEQYRKDPLRMSNFNWENLINPIDEEKLNKRLKDMTANATEQTNGMWKVGVEEVSKERILESAKNQVYSDPENQAFIQQQIKFKNPDYYDERYAKVTGGSGYYEQMYFSNNEVDETGQAKILTDKEAGEQEAAFLNSLDEYAKDLKNKKKDLVIPERTYSVKKGAIQRLFDSAVGANAYTKSKLDQNPVYFANANLALAQEGQKLREKVFNQGINNSNVAAYSKLQSNSLANIKIINDALSYIPSDTTDPVQIKRREFLQDKLINEIADKETWENAMLTIIDK